VITPELAPFASRVMAHLADAALRSIVLACLAALALRAFRVRHVSVQLAAWKGLLYAALAMPVLAWLLPAIPVHFQLPAKEVAVGPSFGNDATAQPNPTGPAEAIERSGRPLQEDRAMPTLRVVSGKAKSLTDWPRASAASPVSAGNSSRQTSIAQALPQHGPQGDASLRLGQFASGLGRKLGPALTRLPRVTRVTPVLIFYALGLIFLTGRLGVGFFLSRRLRRGARPIDDPRALRWLKWHAVAMGTPRVPLLAESPGVSVPVTFGVLRPVIVIPSDWRDWPSAKLAAVMAHEVSHIKRNDSRTRTLALIYRAIFWFSPLGWWLERHLADLAEQASDQAAIRAGAEPTYYAEVLMSFFEISTTQGRVIWQGVSMARGLHASKRIERVLSSAGAVPAAMRTPIVVLLALCALPMLCLTAATRPVLVAAADSAVSQPSSQASGPALASLQQPEPPPPAEPAPPADSAPPAPSALPAPVAPAFSYATPLAPAAPLAPPAPQAAPLPAAPPALDAPPAPPSPDSLGQLYRQIQQMSDQAHALSASTHRREMLAVALAAYAKAAGAYRYAYLQSEGASVTNSEDDDDNWTFSTFREGMDFAIASGKSVMMLGSESEDNRDQVKSLQKKISGDFIWFIHSGNAYVIRDAATVKSAKALFAPMEELGRKQEALGKQQEELGKQQEELGRQQEQVRVKVPADLEARLKKVEAEIRELGPSATQDDLGRIQGELGDLQGYIGDLQGKAGEQQGELGGRQGELGEKQGELGRQQGEMGEEQGRIAREGARKMQTILKHALDSGLAQRAPG